MAPSNRFKLISALPDFFTRNSRGSEIAISADGGFLYASNRGYDSIAIFGVDQAGECLLANGWQISNGKTPRVANEESDNIVTCQIDQSNGRSRWLKEGSLSAVRYA